MGYTPLPTLFIWIVFGFVLIGLGMATYEPPMVSNVPQVCLTRSC